jgi:hypothetical protein
MRPLFVYPLARSGGTLMATMLDAHPEMAMSYEIYEDLLVDAEGAILTVKQAQDMTSGPHSDDKAWVKSISSPKFKSFCARALRAGLKPTDVTSSLEWAKTHLQSFESLENRLQFIHRLMKLKAEKTNKPIWGGKAKVNLEDLINAEPSAYILAMVRDGRDILASRKTKGNFNSEPASVARDWVNYIKSFKDFLDKHPESGQFIHYENLVNDPEPQLREVCSAVGIDFSKEMVHYHKSDIALFDNSYGHLSSEQLKSGLSSASIGQYASLLSKQEILEFENIAKDLLTEFEYRCQTEST